MTKNDITSISVQTLNKVPDIRIIKGTRKYKYKLYTFIIITLLQIFINYDIGVVPVSLNWIQEPYNFTSTELGIMGSLLYIAYAVMSPFMSYIFLTFSTQRSVTISSLINLLSLVAYALSFNKYMFFVSKFCIGASQSLLTTYCPLWVDTFAPKFHRNLWMSIIQGGVVIGMTVGYTVTSLFSFARDKGWRYSIFTQVICGFILIVLFYLIPKEFVNFDPSRDERVDFNLCSCENSFSDNIKVDIDKDVSLTSSSDNLSNSKHSILKRYRSLDFVSKVSSLGMSDNELLSRTRSSFDTSTNKSEYSKCSKCFVNNVKLYQETISVKNLSAWSKFKMLIKQNIYILTCIATSYSQYCCNGVYFWMTKIYVTHFKMNEKAVYFIFSLQVITGMLFGTITSSRILDQIIYHYPDHPLLVDTTLIVWSSITLLMGIIVIIFNYPITYVIGVFITFFFQSSLIPPLTLQAVECLPHRLKPAGSTFFICQFQILGFALGAIIPGIAMDMFNSYTAALCVIYLPGFIGLGSLVSILYIKHNSFKRQ